MTDNDGVGRGGTLQCNFSTCDSWGCWILVGRGRLMLYLGQSINPVTRALKHEFCMKIYWKILLCFFLQRGMFLWISEKLEKKSVYSWDHFEVGTWLDLIGCGDYKVIFKQHDIRGPELVALERHDLQVINMIFEPEFYHGAIVKQAWDFFPGNFWNFHQTFSRFFCVFRKFYIFQSLISDVEAKWMFRVEVLGWNPLNQTRCARLIFLLIFLTFIF